MGTGVSWFVFVCVLYVAGKTSAYRATTLPTARQQFQRLLSWAEQNGALLGRNVGHKFHCYGGTPSITYVATDDILPGDILLQVPSQLLYRVDEKTSPLLAYVQQPGKEKIRQFLDVNKQVTLALQFMLDEKKQEEHFMKPYIDFFPRHASSAIYFSNETLARAGHVTLSQKIKERAEKLKKIANIIQTQLVPHVPELHDFTREAFLRAWILVTSRAHGITSVRDSRLVPLGDLFNHASSACPDDMSLDETHYMYDQEQDAFVIKSPSFFAAGEDVRICYGNVANVNLLLDYGFAERNNRFDALRIDAVLNGPHKEKQLAVLKVLKLPKVYYLNSSVIVPRKFALSMRVGQFEVEKLDSLLSLTTDPPAMMSILEDQVQPVHFMYPSIVAQSIVFERFRANKNDENEMNALVSFLNDQSMCLTEAPRKQAAAHAAMATLAALTLKLERMKLAKTIGDNALQKYAASLNTLSQDELAQLNTTAMKNIIFGSLYRRYETKQIGHRKNNFKEAIRGMWYDVNGVLVQPTPLVSASTNVRPPMAGAHVVQNFDNTVTVHWPGSHRTFASMVEAQRFLHGPSRNAPNQPAWSYRPVPQYRAFPQQLYTPSTSGIPASSSPRKWHAMGQTGHLPQAPRVFSAEKRATLEKAVMDIIEKINLDEKLFKAGSREMDQIKDIMKDKKFVAEFTDKMLGRLFSGMDEVVKDKLYAIAGDRLVQRGTD